MKKFFVLLLTFALMFVLSFAFYGCYLEDESSPDAPDNKDSEASQEQQEEKEEEFVLPVPDPEQSLFKDISYGSSSKHTFDILLPQPLKEAETPMPFFLLIHGGSWTGGDKSEFYFLSDLLNTYQYAAVTINYRLLGEGINYLDMLDDIRSAVSYIKKIAPAYQLKTDRMGVVGSSAGGHLALLYSLKCAAASPIPVSLLVSLVGPTDFSDPAFYTEGYLTTEEKLTLISSLLGTTVHQEMITSGSFPEALYDASPITHVKAGFPATLLAYGGKDKLVPYSNGQRLYDALSAHHADKVRLIIFPNSGHELDKDADKMAEATLALLFFANTYLPK